MLPFVRLCAGVAVVLALPYSAFAQPPGQLKKAPNQVVETGEKDDTVIEIAGQRVAIDPQTGRIRQPTPEEAAALSAALEQQFGKRAQGATLRYLSNGTVGAQLDESFMEAMTVTRRPDGSLQFGHATGLAEATRAVKAADTKAKAPAAKPTNTKAKAATPKSVTPKAPMLEEKE